jgi:hypothetical protein
MQNVFLGRGFTRDEAILEHQRSLADFMDVRQETLNVDLYGEGAMAHAHQIAMRFKAAKSNCTKWAHIVASLLG